jgi:metal-responsive CopG/Arc/MetJ family transcriptional regulator
MTEEPSMRVSIELRASVLAWLDDLREQCGVASRGEMLNQILEELIMQPDDDQHPANSR